MNAAEKARLAKEKEEQARQKKREQAEQKRKKQLQRTTEDAQKFTGVVLLILAAVSIIVSLVFGIQLLTSYTEGLSTMEILFGGNRMGNMDVEVAKKCWVMVAVDLVILGLMFLHYRWCDKMLLFGGEIGWAIFIIYAIGAGILLLGVGFCHLLYLTAA